MEPLINPAEYDFFQEREFSHAQMCKKHITCVMLLKEILKYPDLLYYCTVLRTVFTVFLFLLSQGHQKVE